MNLDLKTRIAYQQNAEAYSQDWLGQPEPSDMYQLLKTYFHPNGETADIGCGNGRDASWLARNGYRVFGFDASAELMSIASKQYPEISFRQAFLPELKEINQEFDNVLCETVIMHLPQEQLVSALENLKRILKSEGILYLSWRVTEGEDARHPDGRLYSAFALDLVLNQFDRNGQLHFEDQISQSSGKRICRLIYKNTGGPNEK